MDEALRFGWIDSVKRQIDGEEYRHYFSKRKAVSSWSKTNKDKVKELIENGLMSEGGIRTIEIAKSYGSWSILDTVEALVIPKD